jgi:hypothetical protein
VSTVCGNCERKDGRMLSEGQVGGIGIQRETLESSLPYQAIASHCHSNGWDDLVVKSERVLDRRALLQPHLPGLTVRSVTVERDGEEWTVKVLDYVEVAFI